MLITSYTLMIICAINLTSLALHNLLMRCNAYCTLHDLKLKAKKSVSMFFRWAIHTNVVYQLYTLVVTKLILTKYLGGLLHCMLKTTIDVSRQTRRFYVQANMLIMNTLFTRCECMLFKTYCLIQ